VFGGDLQWLATGWLRGQKQREEVEGKHGRGRGISRHTREQRKREGKEGRRKEELTVSNKEAE